MRYTEAAGICENEVMTMASVLKLIDKQLATWRLKQDLEELMRPGRCIEGGVAYGPCLLVSRQCGSQGTELARRLGERLGWHVFDREILNEIAQLAQTRTRLLETVDEKTRAHWGERWQSELAPDDIGYEAYLRYLRQVVLTLAHHGEVIILGRGAHYLLPSQCSLRVRVVGPLEQRIEHIVKTTKLSSEEAQAYVEKMDADRAEFVRRSFRHDPDSPLNYDLVINTGQISIETSVEVAIKALEDKLHIPRPRR